MMHRSALSEDEPMSEINLIPLIDISLTLVIILMVTTVFIQNPGLKLNLPKTSTREGAPPTAKDLTVTVALDGRYFVNGQPETLAQIQGILNLAAQQNIGQSVIVKGDRSVAYQQVVNVMDAARKARLSRIILSTDPKINP